MWNLKRMTQMNLLINQKQTQIEKNLRLTKGKLWVGRSIRNLGLTNTHYHNKRQINHKNIQYSTGNYIWYRVIIYKEFEKEYHFAGHLKLTQHCESLYSSKILKTHTHLGDKTVRKQALPYTASEYIFVQPFYESENI